MVNNFVYQENAHDCGVFVCYFFECLSSGVGLGTGGSDRGINISDYRNWIVFSNFANRIMGHIKRTSSTAGIVKDKEDGSSKKPIPLDV